MGLSMASIHKYIGLSDLMVLHHIPDTVAILMEATNHLRTVAMKNLGMVAIKNLSMVVTKNLITEATRNLKPHPQLNPMQITKVTSKVINGLKNKKDCDFFLAAFVMQN